MMFAVVLLAVVEVVLVSSQAELNVTTTVKATTDMTTMKATTDMTTMKATTDMTTMKAKTDMTTMKATTDMTTMKATTDTPATSPPGEKTWVVSDSSGDPCILAKMDATITVSYEKTDNTTVVVPLKLPENAQVNTNMSTCGNATQPAQLVLYWNENVVQQVFVLNSTSNTYSLSDFIANVLHDPVHFPDSTEEGKIVNYTGTPPAMFFETSVNKSYKCNSMQSFDLKPKSNVTYTNVKVQPFGVNNTFSDEFQCAADPSTTTPMLTSPMLTTMPTPKPTPSPAGNWTVKDGNVTCMNMTFKASITIKYTNTTNKTVELTLPLPDNASADSSTCSDKMSNFVLTFFNGWEMSMLFISTNAKDSSGDYSLVNYTLTYVYDERFTNPQKRGVTEMVFNNKTTNIGAQMGRYYKCDTTSKIEADNTVTMLSEMKLQPFAKVNNGTKGNNYNQCAADDTISNIVPIAVGCALAGLVIIVLVAYLIGRSRSSRQGYQSV